jgi:hypothetical protein
MKRVFIIIIICALIAPVSLLSSLFGGARKVDAAATISKSLRRPVNEIGLVGWWTMDGPDTLQNIADKSGQGNTGNLILGLSGNISTTTAPGRVGQALSFDGVNDYVGGLSNFGQPNTLSISLWFKTSLASWNTLFGQTNVQPPNSASSYISVFAIKGTGVLRAELWTGSVGEISTSFSVRDGTWHHVVMVGNVNSQSLYVDGQLIGSRSGTIQQSWWNYSFIGTGYDDTIRGFPSNSWHYFNGLIDDVRIYNRALSASEVATLYQIGATSKIAKTLPGRDSLTSGLVGWWTFDGPDMLTNVADRSGQGNTGNLILGLSGNISTTTAPGRVGQALSFDGVNDYVSIPDPGTGSILDFDTGSQITIAMWVNRTNNNILVSPIGKGTYSNYAFELDTARRPQFFYSDAQNLGAWQIYRTSAITNNEWHHLVFTYTFGTASSAQWYIDGVPISGSWVGGTGNVAPAKNNESLQIGRWSTSEHFTGLIDDVRIYNRALSASEVATLYQIGATSKIAKTLPGRDSLTSGLVGWWTFDGPDMLTNVADRSGQGNTGNLILGLSGNISTTTAPGRVGQALSFDGVDDYVSISSLNLSGTNVVTLAFWMKRPSFSVNKNTFEFTTNFNSFSDGFGFFINDTPTCGPGDIEVAIKGDVGYNIRCYNEPSVNEWHHYVAIYNKGAPNPEQSLYIDGVLQTAASNPYTNDNTNNFGNRPFFMMSRNGQSQFDTGQLDDVRIYNRALSADEVLQLYNLGR